jgi:uncharacterized protein YdhG (YjbR/CyaY superfamily)
MTAKKPKTVDEFIAQYPADVQKKLKSVRATIRKAAPKAVESISYGIAAYKLDGKALIYFSGAKAHIGVYPRAKAMDEELADYISGKGTYKFPLDEKLPLTLIAKVVKARMREI